MENYALQFGKKAIPSRFFEVPSELYVDAYTQCLRLKHGRRALHDYQEGDRCHQCTVCRGENRRNPCDVCHRRMRNQPRFVQRALVLNVGHGLLQASYDHDKVWCTPCAQKICQTHPSYPLIADPKAVHLLCKLNQKDFPPYWAVGRRLMRSNVFYDQEDGMDNNLWNPILDLPAYDEVADPKVVDKADLCDALVVFSDSD